MHQTGPLVGDGEEAEHPVVIRDRLAKGNDAAVDPSGPVDLPQEHHPPLVVPNAVDEIERLRSAAHEARGTARALGLADEIREHAPALLMRVRERTPLDIATDVHLEPEPMAGVDELGQDLRLRRLPRDEPVLIEEAPAPVVGLRGVRGDAAFDQLAVGGLDPAEQAVDATQQRTRVDLARR